MNKKDLSESDIKAKFITPAITGAGWDEQTQLGREIFFTDGRIYVKGRMTARGKRKFADYILFYKPNVPIAVIEAKDNNTELFINEAADLMYHYLILKRLQAELIIH